VLAAGLHGGKPIDNVRKEGVYLVPLKIVFYILLRREEGKEIKREGLKKGSGMRKPLGNSHLAWVQQPKRGGSQDLRSDIHGVRRKRVQRATILETKIVTQKGRPIISFWEGRILDRLSTGGESSKRN